MGFCVWIAAILPGSASGEHSVTSEAMAIWASAACAGERLGL